MFNQAPRDREPSIAETIRSDNGRSQPYVPRALGYGNRDDIPAFREQQRFDEALMRDREREQRERTADMERKRDIELREREFMRQREIEANRERENRERERERDLRQREAQEREREIMRERERDRMDQARNAGPFPRHEPMQQQQQQQQYAPRPYVPQPGPFGAREPEAWMRRPEERDPRELGIPQPPPGYQVQREVVQPYGPAPGYQQPRYAPRDPREYESQPAHQQPQHQPHYGSPLQERERMHGPQPMQQHQQQQYAPQGPQGPYRPNESPRARSNEEVQNMQRGVYLGIQQEINRKGRNSPFPQAVQGAQGPPGEPGIKSEFGKMFSGIGSGVGSIGGGTASGGSLTPFQAGSRRDDLEAVAALDSPTDGLNMARQNSRGGRRRKLQDNDKEGNDSTGRRTPTGRKRPKQAPQLAIGPQRQYALFTHIAEKRTLLTRYSVSETDPITRLSSPSQPSLTPTFGQHQHGMGPSPPRKAVPHHHHIKHHHHPHGSRHPSQAPQVIIPKPKLVVKNKALMDSIAYLPHKHLGHIMYEATLTPGDPPSLEHAHGLPRRGFSSNSKPIPKDLIEGKEGCRLTVRVPRIYLGHTAREEITARRAVWGTDVYTDDSDVVASCIHAGWIQGAWPEEIDISALDLIVNGATSGDEMPNGKKINGRAKGGKKEDIVLEDPPKSGPKVPPKDRDMYVTICILPALEKYASTIRWGMKSREWKDTHDGLSFMIESVRFMSGVDTAAEIRGNGRRIRITAGMKEDELERKEEAGLLLALANGMGSAQGDVDMIDIGLATGGAEESFVRGDGGMKGLGMGSWWKKQEKKVEPVVEEVMPSPSPSPALEALPVHSPEEQRQPQSHSQQKVRLEGPEVQEHRITHEQMQEMERAVRHIEEHHQVELQPPEIEPLSSPTLAPVQEADMNAQVNGQRQQHQHVKNEVDMTNAWSQLPQPVHHQPVQNESIHQQPAQEQALHAAPVRQPSQHELQEMYEHPLPAPKDGSPLENQRVEEAAVEEQVVMQEEPLVVKVPEAVPETRVEGEVKVPEVSTEVATNVMIEEQMAREDNASLPDGNEEIGMEVDQPAAA